MIYISVYFTALLASLGGLSKGFPAKKLYLVLCFFIFLVVALRYASVDYFGYLSIYEGVGNLSNFGFFIYELNSSTPVESGFALLILLEKLIFGHFFIFVFFFSFLSLAIKFSAFKKLSPYLLLSVLLYLSDEYFWKEVGQIRNAMASGILLWAFYHAYFRRFILYLLLVIVAMLFHSAAIIALPFYFVRWFKSPYILSFSLLLSIILVGITGGLGAAIPDIALSLGFDDSSRLIKYADSQHASGINAFGGTFSLQLFVCGCLIIFNGKLVDKWSYNELLIPIYIYSSCLFFVFIDYGIIGGRIREMLSIPVACVVIPSFVLLFRGYSKFAPFAAIVFYCFVWFYMMMRDRAPYQSILQFVV